MDCQQVALRKESVDRNDGGEVRVNEHRVALRKESVDRNMAASLLLAVQLTSLSARRAWIEIVFPALNPHRCVVALRKESVDRNVRPPLL